MCSGGNGSINVGIGEPTQWKIQPLKLDGRNMKFVRPYAMVFFRISGPLIHSHRHCFQNQMYNTKIINTPAFGSRFLHVSFKGYDDVITN